MLFPQLLEAAINTVVTHLELMTLFMECNSWQPGVSDEIVFASVIGSQGRDIVTGVQLGLKGVEGSNMGHIGVGRFRMGLWG